jgi:hypothetical protein
MVTVAPRSWSRSCAAHVVPGILTPRGLPPPFALFLTMLVVNSIAMLLARRGVLG